MALKEDDPGYEFLKARVLSLLGVDLGSYKESQMRRRLGGLLERLGISSFQEYAARLEKEERLRREFLDFITINVSEFFRNPDRFRELETMILPDLYRRDRPFRAWSAGTANGAEAYSLAILLFEHPPLRGARVLATDIDRQMLEQAREGIYTEQDLKNVDPARRKRFFRPDGDRYRVTDALRSLVEVRRHDLLRDPYPTDLDLIVCRNVIIYFTDEAKAHLFRGFRSSLREGGVLFLGGTESFFNSRDYGFETIRPFFYRAVKHD